MNASPALSAATLVGCRRSPESTVVWTPVGNTSTTRLLPLSAINTFPIPSIATPVGSKSPEPTVVWTPVRRHLDDPVVAGVGDEHVAGRVDRRAGGLTEPGADRGLHTVRE